MLKLRERARDRQEQASKRSLMFPSVEAHVRLLVDDITLDCVVTRVGPLDLDVVLPGGGFVVDDGTIVTVEWPNGHGLTSLRARVETIGLGEWRVVPLEGPEEHQRRAYVRVAARIRVQVRLDAIPPMHVYTIDVSEGGFSFHLSDDVQQLPAAGDVGKVTVYLESERVRMNVEIVRVRELEEGRELACRFIPPYPDDVIRRWVRQTELNQRARRRTARP